MCELLFICGVGCVWVYLDDMVGNAKGIHQVQCLRGHLLAQAPYLFTDLFACMACKYKEREKNLECKNDTHTPHIMYIYIYISLAAVMWSKHAIKMTALQSFRPPKRYIWQATVVLFCFVFSLEYSTLFQRDNSLAEEPRYVVLDAGQSVQSEQGGKNRTKRWVTAL